MKIIVVDRDSTSSLEAAKAELTPFIDLAGTEPVPHTTFAGRLLSTWSALPAAPKPLPSKVRSALHFFQTMNNLGFNANRLSSNRSL